MCVRAPGSGIVVRRHAHAPAHAGGALMRVAGASERRRKRCSARGCSDVEGPAVPAGPATLRVIADRRLPRRPDARQGRHPGASEPGRRRGGAPGELSPGRWPAGRGTRRTSDSGVLPEEGPGRVPRGRRRAKSRAYAVAGARSQPGIRRASRPWKSPAGQRDAPAAPGTPPRRRAAHKVLQASTGLSARRRGSRHRLCGGVMPPAVLA